MRHTNRSRWIDGSKRLGAAVLVSCVAAWLGAAPPTNGTRVTEIRAQLLRQEARSYGAARTYYDLTWTLDGDFWIKRHAARILWTGAAVGKLECTAHALLPNPRGPGEWHVLRRFLTADVRRFRQECRLSWVGHLNARLASLAPPPHILDPRNRTFTVSVDRIELVLPMEPQDPNPTTPGNEAVEIVDEEGKSHLLGDPGFTFLPDSALNPGGFRLFTTSTTSTLLPPVSERLKDSYQVPAGVVEVSPGLLLEFLVDEAGQVLVDRNGDGKRDPIESPGVLGGQKHQGLLALPSDQHGTPLGIDQGVHPLQLHAWLLGATGNVLGAGSAQVVMGPQQDLDQDGKADNPIGSPAPLQPTVRSMELEAGVWTETVDASVAPVDLYLPEEDPPTAAELSAFNGKLATQLPSFPPLVPPFHLGVGGFRARRIRCIEERVLFDTALTRLTFAAKVNVPLDENAYRLRLSRAALTDLRLEQEFLTGQGLDSKRTVVLDEVRFFRAGLRLFQPEPDTVRVMVDDLWLATAAVPDAVISVAFIVRPDVPISGHDLLSLESNEARLLPGEVLTGMEPDGLPYGEDGALLEELPLGATADIVLGGTGIFNGALGPLDIPPGGLEVELESSGGNPAESPADELPLTSWSLDEEGRLGRRPMDPVEDFNLPATPKFRRGDFNCDRCVDIEDVIAHFGYLFLGSRDPCCWDAADANDDGGLDIDDGIFLLDFLYCSGPEGCRKCVEASPDDPDVCVRWVDFVAEPVPAPGPSECGEDPTPDGLDKRCDYPEVNCSLSCGDQPPGIPLDRSEPPRLPSSRRSESSGDGGGAAVAADDPTRISLVIAAVTSAGRQIPGDCNQDGTLDISDGVCLLNFLFLGTLTALPCGDGSLADPGNTALLDSNGDRTVDLSDSVRIFGYLFLGLAPPALGTQCTPLAGCSDACAGGAR